MLTPFKLKGCGQCGGDLHLDDGDWLCFQCGTYYYTGAVLPLSGNPRLPGQHREGRPGLLEKEESEP